MEREENFEKYETLNVTQFKLLFHSHNIMYIVAIIIFEYKYTRIN